LQCSLLNSNGARLSAAVRYRGQGDTDRSIVSNYFYFNQRLEKFRLNGTRRNLGSVPITVKELFFLTVLDVSLAFVAFARAAVHLMFNIMGKI
jgi:hypothetical protein